MGKHKHLILKTAAVVSCVVVLGITGCQGGNNEAAAVKNKSNIEVSIQNAKGESVDVQRDGKEDIEAVGRFAEPARASVEAGGSDTKSVDGSVGSERGDTQAKSETKPLKAESGVSGEGDKGTDSSSESPGAGDGFDAESAVSDPVSVADSASNMDGQDESDSSAGWDGGMENDSAVSEYSEPGYTEQYDYDSTYQYEYEDPGTVEEGEDAEGAGESVSESEVPGESVETVEEESYDSGWEYYGTAFITHFCPCEICCGSYASGVTASGTWATEGRTVAAGYSIPFGAEVMINGNVYIVEDRGVDDGCFDVFVSDHDTALAMGAYYTDVYIRW